jgi:hypothetical protein
MATKIQLRRGTDAQRLTKVFDVGEPVVTTDTKKLYIGDGVTTGGVEVGGVTTAEVEALISAHEAAGDPHPQYTTDAEAEAFVTSHEAASDPHPQYTTKAIAMAIALG